MKYILKRNPIDLDMIEFWFTIKNRNHLAAVMHEDCVDDPEIREELQYGDVEVTLSSAND